MRFKACGNALYSVCSLFVQMMDGNLWASKKDFVVHPISGKSNSNDDPFEVDEASYKTAYGMLVELVCNCRSILIAQQSIEAISRIISNAYFDSGDSSPLASTFEESAAARYSLLTCVLQSMQSPCISRRNFAKSTYFVRSYLCNLFAESEPRQKDSFVALLKSEAVLSRQLGDTLVESICKATAMRVRKKRKFSAADLSFPFLFNVASSVFYAVELSEKGIIRISSHEKCRLGKLLLDFCFCRFYPVQRCALDALEKLQHCTDALFKDSSLKLTRASTLNTRMDEVSKLVASIVLPENEICNESEAKAHDVKVRDAIKNIVRILSLSEVFLVDGKYAKSTDRRIIDGIDVYKRESRSLVSYFVSIAPLFIQNRATDMWEQISFTSKNIIRRENMLKTFGTVEKVAGIAEEFVEFYTLLKPPKEKSWQESRKREMAFVSVFESDFAFRNAEASLSSVTSTTLNHTSHSSLVGESSDSKGSVIE